MQKVKITGPARRFPIGITFQAADNPLIILLESPSREKARSLLCNRGWLLHNLAVGGADLHTPNDGEVSPALSLNAGCGRRL